MMTKWSICLLFLIILSLLPATAHAKDKVDVINGKITFQTESTQATTSIRYRTTGFMLHRKPLCEPGKVQCNPMAYPPIGVIEKLQQVGEEEIGDGMVRTYFEVPEEEASAALGKAGLEEIREGDTIYISSIFQVVHGSTMLPKKYYDLQGIKKAESWADPNRFGQFYDIQVKYSAYFPSYAVIKLSDGTEIDKKKIENNSLPKHLNWPVGSNIKHTFEKELDYNGKKYKIYKSYIQSIRKPNEQRFQQEGNPDTNPTLTQRNYNVGLGGTNVVGVYKESGGPPPTIPDTPKPSGRCTAPTPGTPVEAKVMDPKVTAKILADSRGNEQFDVSLGIPTSESLFGNTFALNYLFQNKFVPMSGTCTYEVPVSKTFIKTWSETRERPDGTTYTEEMSEPEVVSDTITVERPYSYWVIENLDVYKIEESKLQNTALPGGEVTLSPSGYTPPDYEVVQNAGIVSEPSPQSVTLPSQTVGDSIPSYSSEFKSAAEKVIGKVKVRNDSLRFKGNTVMNGDVTDERGPAPGTIPQPFQINENVLYIDRQLIESHKENEKDIASTGTIYYRNVNGGANKQFLIDGINTVTIHTPVVNYSSVTDDHAHNQKTKPNHNRAAFILDRPFKVRIPTNGQHVNYPGYGNRDYAKYFRTKQVWFPFDVYNADRTQFIPKKTWIDIPVNQLDTTFFLPVWVDEGDYTVRYRSIAENAPANFEYQPDANTDLINHVASDEVDVEVIGRVYDFHITDIADYNWETVFRTEKGSKNPTGVSYWVGYNDIDGTPRGNRAPFTLPIRPGSHPIQGYKNVSVKTGYHVKFDLKSKGTLFGQQDGIRITPAFYFVSKDGKTRFPVDLYYHSNNKNFIKIGSKEDKVNRYVILNERLRNVPIQELTDTANYKYDHYSAGQNMTRSQYVDDFINKSSKQKTTVGGYSLLLLPEQIRTFIGPKIVPSSVDTQRANASIQRWYGDYSLPADPYVVKVGTNIAEYGRTHGGLSDESPIFLKDGYIIVNFNIETIRNADLKNPHLQYIHAPLMNQWQLEGFHRNIQDSYGNKFSVLDGDIVFYNADKSSRDDFSSQVPH
ncbi:DUF5704 domain-containing protein [Bacillus cereus]|nr:DUF5704 domain-containing protein [Bacillus cereus]